jgi:hypothetical protein
MYEISASGAVFAPEAEISLAADRKPPIASRRSQAADRKPAIASRRSLAGDR